MQIRSNRKWLNRKILLFSGVLLFYTLSIVAYAYVQYNFEKKRLANRQTLSIPSDRDNRMAGTKDSFVANIPRMIPLIILMLVTIVPFMIYFIVTNRRDRNELLKKITTDNLTLLPNRTKLFQDINESATPILILINIDAFQEINDFYGNIAGDFLLVSIANRLKGVVELIPHQIYKLPADEYAILFNSVMGNEMLEKYLHLIWAAITEKPFHFSGSRIHINVRIGAFKPDPSRIGDPDMWDNMAVRADMALKNAKKSHKNFQIYDESMNSAKQYEQNILWTRKIKEALFEDRIVPFFQPIVRCSDSQPAEYECLARLIDPDGTVNGPNSFIELSKKSQVYHSITQTIFRKSTEVFYESRCGFSINISILDIEDPETRSLFLYTIKEHPELCHRLIFEIVESEGIENYDSIKEFTTLVKSSGCRIAIDDFGSGYSNFSHILKLNADFLKIDASLIKNIVEDHYSQILTKNIVSVAKDLGIQTIAEYVHNEAVFLKVRELGVDYAQGFYFGQPNPSLKLHCD